MEIDNVNYPSHYTWLKDECGVEVIDIVRHLDFCRGNAIKYLLRAGRKESVGKTSLEKEIEDLKKAEWYVKDLISQLEKQKQVEDENYREKFENYQEKFERDSETFDSLR